MSMSPHKVVKALDMRDGLVGLNGKLEAGRCFRHPAHEQLFCWQAPKRVVDFQQS